jgi:superfamily I DNA and/or RNA helicase
MLKNYYENRSGLPTINIKVALTNNAIKNVTGTLKKYCLNSKDVMPFTYGLDDHVNYEEDRAKKYLTGIVSEYEEYDVYLQNGGYSKDDNSIVVYFATDTNNPNNAELKNKLDSHALCFVGVNKEDEGKLLLTSVNLRPYLAGSSSNRSVAVRAEFHFNYNIKAAEIPNSIINQVMDFPVARERSEEIEQRIKDWDSYLRIIEDSAREDEYTIDYEGYKQDREIRCVTFIIHDEKIDWQKIKKAKERQERVKLVEDEDISIGGDKVYEGPYIGMIDEINQSRSEIRIELDVDYQEKSQQGKLDIPQHGILYFSKLGDLAQAKRLREGLKRLQYGKAVNPHLEEFLFDACSAQLPQAQFKLEPEKFLLKSLNESQKRAVEGSLVADDLYLIQGPPGTGKTTVIAEICYQNAIKGKKTLIASQSNLAVDNALSRLVHDPKIRALRKGNISRVEEEGKPFTEDKVIQTWLTKTAENCRQSLDNAVQGKSKFVNLYDRLATVIEMHEKYRAIRKDAAALKKIIRGRNNTLNRLETNFGYFKKKSKSLTASILDQIRVDFNNAGFQSDSLWNEFGSCLKKTKEIEESLIQCRDCLKILISKREEFDLKNPLILDNNELDQIRVDFNNAGLQSDVLWDEYAGSLKKNKIVDESIRDLSNKRERLLSLEKKIDFDTAKIKEAIAKNKKATSGTQYDEMLVDKPGLDLSKEGLEFCKGVEIHLLNKPKWIFKLFPVTKKWRQKVIGFCKDGEYLHLLIEEQINKTDNLIQNLDVEKSKIEAQIGSVYSRIKSEIEEQINKTDNLVQNLDVEKSKIEAQIGSVYSRIKSEIEEQIDKLDELIVSDKNKSQDIEDKFLSITNAIEEYNAEFPPEMLSAVTIRKTLRLRDIELIYKEPLTKSIEYLDRKIDILSEWIERIKSPEKENRTMLKQIYIDNANVIGITCVQSGSRNFSESYPNFDVVVVDEVSKATPPELLLPMLKGGKIVLVGDHKQLPPMVDENTLDELAEKYGYPKGALEHLERCLFKELYEDAPRELKTMLNVQYRMHNSIMDAINQFYIDEDSEGLICGIQEPDKERQHLCGNRLIKNNQHILWIDVPLDSSYYEKRSGTSWYNQTEVEVIKRIFEEINEGYKANIEDKASRNSIKKEVGVITFYAAQSRLLQKELLAPGLLKYDSLILRVATVDRFQGMERPVVIVSLVRNNHDGKIGFAEKPERINVALSRAQELLVIVGCSELFCEKTKSSHAIQLYGKVRNTIKKHGGLIDIHDFNYLPR